jgi:hypothetical protein
MAVRSLRPSQRLILRSSLALAVWSPLHLAIPMIHHRLSIAVVATGRDVLASDPWIERVVSPTNFAVFHNFDPLQ